MCNLPQPVAIFYWTSDTQKQKRKFSSEKQTIYLSSNFKDTVLLLEVSYYEKHYVFKQWTQEQCQKVTYEITYDVGQNFNP